MAELIVKKNVRNNRLHLSICDEKLLGKRLEEGEKSLNLDGDFFNGEKTSEDEIKPLLDKCVSVSFVGENSISLGKLNFGDIVIKKVDGIPFSNVVRM